MPFECMQAAAVVQMTVLAMCFFGEKAFEVRQSADLVACLRQLDRCIGLLCMYVCPDTNKLPAFVCSSWVCNLPRYVRYASASSELVLSACATP
jgi:hypothetical protein